MTETELANIRLECLRIAQAQLYSGDNLIKHADRLLEFVLHGKVPNPPQVNT